MKELFLILLLALLLSCRTTMETISTSDPDKLGVRSNRFKGTIFTHSYSQPLFSSFEGRPRFTPSKEDIALAEAVLRAQIRKVNDRHLNQLGRRQYIENNLDNYFRQYVGFFNEQGERVVYMNSHWDRFSLLDRLKGYWDSRLAYDSDYSITHDGGSRYWSVYVNLSTRTLYGLSVNGYG